MALIQTVNPSELYHMACRMDRGDQFGYKGWNALGEYLENLSEAIGEDIEVDIIAICCDYSMCEDVEEFYSEFGDAMCLSESEWESFDDDDKLSAVESYLQDKTSVVCIEDNLIIWQAF